MKQNEIISKKVEKTKINTDKKLERFNKLSKALRNNLERRKQKKNYDTK